MIWVIYFAVLIAISVFAIIIQRKKSTQTIVTNFNAPLKVDLSDFDELNGDFLVAIFTSKSCQSCSNVLSKAKVLESKSVDVVELDYEDPKGKILHKKYEIEAVPTLIICDNSGVVMKSHIGPISATDLWADLARARGGEVGGCSNH